MAASGAMRMRAMSSGAGDDQASWLRGLNDWRAKHAAEMDAPDGWLSLTGLNWLKEGDNSFGADADESVSRRGRRGSSPWRAASGGRRGSFIAADRPASLPAFSWMSKPPQANQEIRVDSEHPSTLTVGTLTMLVIHRGDRFALRVKDARAPARVNFRGLKWFAPNRGIRRPRKMDSLQSSENTFDRYRDRHHDQVSRARGGGVFA